MAWRKKLPNPVRYKRSQYILAVLLAVTLTICGLLAWILLRGGPDVVVEPVSISEYSANQEEDTQVTAPPELDDSEFDAVELQKIIDNWVDVSGDSGVVLADTDGNIIAEKNPEDVFFAASIYKLYVAYAGYQQLDSGLVDESELYINGHTRLECLDLMIKESDSPCAEKLWVELGKQELTDKFFELGIKNTSFTAINTAAYDSALLLGIIARGEGLSERSKELLLESMRTQVYRDTLNKGFSSDVVVYNKIGFNELNEYHDTAIVEFPDGRQLIVSILTDGVGTAKIAELASLIESAVN